MKKFILQFALMLIIPAYLSAADEPVNEDQLFSGSDTVVENKFEFDKMDEAENKRSVGISGNITSAVSYSKIDKSSESSMMNRNSLQPYIIGDLNFDARLPGGYKGFGSFELKYDASVDENETDEKAAVYSVKELFVDFNFDRYAYFRTGKQVLSWGQCYLWNPTDMMNIENKTFLNKLEAREGTYGVKGHIPFGTTVNIYGFADLNQAAEGGDVAGAGKFEFLLKGTEMAFSGWGKKKFNPVYGYDFSGRVFGIDIKGEASYSHGSNKEKIVNQNGILSAVKDDDKNIYKASINIGRAFDFGEINDRINISMELFYNGDGYSDNPIGDENIYVFDKPVEFNKDGVLYKIPAGYKKIYLAGHGLYEPNYLSRYYGAIFITVTEFIISDITLNLNGITNFQQKSYIASSSLNYTNINNFTAGVTANAYLGDKNGEYRAGGVDFDITVKAGILF